MQLSTLNIVVFLLSVFILKSVCELEPKTSLVFVIDKTKSMAPVIKQVNDKSLSILETVVKSPETPVENFVLVYFADPHVNNATVTTDIDEFRNALDLKEDDLENGDDCPELSMNAIEIAINVSLYGSFVYVFTDASAKDYKRFATVKRLVQEKNCQVKFILSNGEFSRDKKVPERSEVYYELAESTSGQVFNMYAAATKWFLEYIKEFAAARKAILHSKKYAPGNHTIELDLDSKSTDLTVTLTKSTDTGLRFSPTVWGPNGEILENEDFDELVNLGQISVLKLEGSDPGKYKMDFETNSATSHLEISSTTDVTFRHGFSTRMVSSLNDTVVNPIPSVKNYLYIKLYGENVQLNTVKLLNVDYGKLLEMSLKIHVIEQNLYITEQFDPPDDSFRIQIKGTDTETGLNITRFGYMVLEKERFITKRPTVTIKGDYKRIVDYNTNFNLECEVEAYPEPQIIWKDLFDGRETEEIVHQHPPYKSKSTFSETAYKNTTYLCRAENKFGSDEKIVKFYVNPKPYINIHGLKNQVIDYGKKADLQCKVDSYPPSKISWHLPKKLLRYRLDTVIYAVNSTLTISSMRPWAVGIYSCKIEYQHQIFWRKVRVSLNASKSIIGKYPWISEIFVSEGETADLTCSLLQGYPKPEMQWFFMNDLYPSAKFREIIEGRNLTSVSLKHLNYLDTGTYYCSAKNILGKDKRYFTVNVECKPTIQNDTKLTKTAELHKEVLFKCEVKGVPTPEVTWYKNDEPLQIDGYRINVFRDHSLRVTGLTEEDSGYYTCKAVNKRGIAEMTLELIVHYLRIDPPDDSKITKNIKQKLELECQADGFPEPILYKWIFHSFDKSVPVKTFSEESEDGELYIRKIKEDQRGLYTCIASNGISSQNITYEVDVLFRPKILYQEPEHKVVEGDLLRISCKATGNPRPNIMWWTDGHPFKGDSFKLAKGPGIYFVNSDDWLTFVNITRMEQGDYHCQAKNSIKAVEGSDIHVTVDSSPPPDQIKHNTVIVLQAGSKAKLKCHLHYGKLDWLVWYKDGKVHHFGELTFDEVTKLNAGIYTCRVTKHDAPDEIQTANTTVIVGSKPTFVMNENEKKEAKFKEIVSLNCVTTGDPMPTITWTLNGKEMRHPDMVLSFIMTAEWVGNILCIVSNDHGSINRTFNMAYKDCVLKIDSKSKEQPLMITTSGDWPSFEITDGYTIIHKYEVVRFICPKKYTYFNTTNIQATCIGGEEFEIDRTVYDHSDIKCKEEIKPRFRKLRKQCLGKNTKSQKLVFDIGHKTLHAIDYCIDKIGNVLFVKHVMRSPANFIPDDISMWDEAHLDYYNCDKQVEKILRYTKVGFDEEKCCYDKRLLVNPRDLFPGPLQRSVFNHLNVVPHWSTCPSENWNEIENRVRKLSRSTNNDLVIYTGIAGYSYTVGGKIMRINGNQLIPKYLWKVIQNPVSKSSIAIIQLNIPGITYREAKEYIICPDICSVIPWIRGPPWQAVKKGFTYCCALKDFVKAFRKQRFDRDFVTAKVFEPYFDLLK